MQIGQLTTKLLKKIYRKLFLKLEQLPGPRIKDTVSSINTILVITDHDLDDDFKKAIEFLDEDYNFTIKKSSKGELTASFVNTFDFVIVYSSQVGLSFNEFTRLKGVKKPSSLYLDTFIPKNIKWLNKFNLIFMPSYEMLKDISFKGYKLHALGIDTSNDKCKYENGTVKETLFKRYNKLKFEKLTQKYEVEYNTSPIWDVKYLSHQLRKGFSFFEEDIKRKTNYIESSKNVKAGRCSFYNSHLLLTGDDPIEIGSFCSFGKYVSIYTSNHDTNYATTQGYLYRKYFKTNHPGEEQEITTRSRSKGGVVIKNDVWVGDNVKIMSGVTIGNGACIGAGSIVTKNVGDYEVVAGVPAKKIKMRFKNPETIKFLLDKKWWDWSDVKIKINKEFFEKNYNTED